MPFANKAPASVQYLPVSKYTEYLKNIEYKNIYFLF